MSLLPDWSISNSRPNCARDPDREKIEHRLRARSPPEVSHYFVHFGKIIHHSVRLMFGQLRTRKASSRDRDSARADRFATRDIVRRIPDHIDLRSGEIDQVFLPRPPLREWTKLVAVVVIIGKRAEFEKIPDPIMREFQFRSAFHISCEEAENVLRSCSQSPQQFLHSREDRSFALRKFARQVINIKIEKGRGRFVVHRDILFS